MHVCKAVADEALEVIDKCDTFNAIKLRSRFNDHSNLSSITFDKHLERIKHSVNVEASLKELQCVS